MISLKNPTKKSSKSIKKSENDEGPIDEFYIITNNNSNSMDLDKSNSSSNQQFSTNHIENPAIASW